MAIVTKEKQVLDETAVAERIIPAFTRYPKSTFKIPGLKQNDQIELAFRINGGAIVDKDSISAGELVTFSCDASNVDFVTFDAGNLGESNPVDSVAKNINSTITVTMTAQNTVGTTTAQVTITVV